MIHKWNKYKILVIFFLFNFGALAFGSFFTTPGINSSWFQALDQAPWNPPGWMFGLAWTIIMICFSVYMAKLYASDDKRDTILLLYVAQ